MIKATMLMLTITGTLSGCATVEAANNPTMLEHLSLETGCAQVRVVQYAPPRLRAEGCGKQWLCRLENGIGSGMSAAMTAGWRCEPR